MRHLNFRRRQHRLLVPPTPNCYEKSRMKSTIGIADFRQINERPRPAEGIGCFVAYSVAVGLRYNAASACNSVSHPSGSPGGAHHGGATHSSGLTDLMLGTHICMGITYKSKYYRINHIAHRLSNRISANFLPSPPSFLYITL